MLNKTKSKIVIEFNHVDNANRLFSFFKTVMKKSDMGGDLEIIYEGVKYYIGHDVRIKKVQHVLFKD